MRDVEDVTPGEAVGALLRRTGGEKRAAAALGTSARQVARWKAGANPQQGSLARLRRTLIAAVDGDDPAKREARLAAMEANAAAGVDLWTGEAPKAARPVADVAAELLPLDVDLRDQAAMLDRSEARTAARRPWGGADDEAEDEA